MTQKNKRYALLNPDSTPIAFYDTYIHGENIPPEAVLITDEQWVEFLENQGQRKLVGGKVVEHDPEPPQITWGDIRKDRDELLKSCDWTQINDSPLVGDADWVNYRQALRDITETNDDPNTVVWPTQPE